MSDMLSTFRTEAAARLAELDKEIANDTRVIADVQAARSARRGERETLTRALAGTVKRTRRSGTTAVGP